MGIVGSACVRQTGSLEKHALSGCEQNTSMIRCVCVCVQVGLVSLFNFYLIALVKCLVYYLWSSFYPLLTEKCCEVHIYSVVLICIQ